MITYAYTIEGTAANGQEWHVNGEVHIETEGAFPDALTAAQREAFLKLTQGKAVYGKPGLGCHGPYKITKLNFKRQ
jgi:hypothetical protein